MVHAFPAVSLRPYRFAAKTCPNMSKLSVRAKLMKVGPCCPSVRNWLTCLLSCYQASGEKEINLRRQPGMPLHSTGQLPSAILPPAVVLPAQGCA